MKPLLLWMNHSYLSLCLAEHCTVHECRHQTETVAFCYLQAHDWWSAVQCNVNAKSRSATVKEGIISSSDTLSVLSPFLSLLILKTKAGRQTLPCFASILSSNRSSTLHASNRASSKTRVAVTGHRLSSVCLSASAYNGADTAEHRLSPVLLPSPFQPANTSRSYKEATVTTSRAQAPEWISLLLGLNFGTSFLNISMIAHTFVLSKLVFYTRIPVIFEFDPII